MVDFQSRDSRLAGDDADEPADEDAASDAHASGETSDDGDGHGGENDHAHGDGHHHAHDAETVTFGVVTVSSSRGEDDDPSGDAIASLLEDDGHRVATREFVPDDFDRVQGVVDRVVRWDDVDAVVTTGGTGVTPDDVTVEAVRPLCEKRLPGFGELFRRLSYDDIGTRVVGTRAEAGVANGVPVFCLPGSEDAVRLGVSEVVLPEVSHLVGLARRPEEHGDGDGDGIEGDAKASDAAEGADGAASVDAAEDDAGEGDESEADAEAP